MCQNSTEPTFDSKYFLTTSGKDTAWLLWYQGILYMYLESTFSSTFYPLKLLVWFIYVSKIECHIHYSQAITSYISHDSQVPLVTRILRYISIKPEEPHSPGPHLPARPHLRIGPPPHRWTVWRSPAPLPFDWSSPALPPFLGRHFVCHLKIFKES